MIERMKVKMYQHSWFSEFNEIFFYRTQNCSLYKLLKMIKLKWFDILCVPQTNSFGHNEVHTGRRGAHGTHAGFCISFILMVSVLHED